MAAQDDELQQLGTLYWFTIEFGVVRQEGRLRAYGAGLLSSFGELQHALGGQPQIRPFDPEVAKDTRYPITEYQPLLWEVGSLREAFDKIRAFAAA